jgi:hypothetical protein
MTEILTESFCERCGTRYTFETARPQNSRLGRARTFTKGLRNYVLSDDSFSEAMADARGEEELAATVLQLDAFHKTFNFCMSCRQYTCANCWHTEEGMCLSCAPLPGGEAIEPLEPGDNEAIAGRLAAIVSEPAATALEGSVSITAWPVADLPSPEEAAPAEAPDSGPAAVEQASTAPTDGATPAVEEVAEPAPELAATSLEEAQAAEPVAGSAESAATPELALQGLKLGESLDDMIAAYEAAHGPDDLAGLAATEAVAGIAADAAAPEAVAPGATPAAAEPAAEHAALPAAEAASAPTAEPAPPAEARQADVEEAAPPVTAERQAEAVASPADVMPEPAVVAEPPQAPPPPPELLQPTPPAATPAPEVPEPVAATAAPAEPVEPPAPSPVPDAAETLAPGWLTVAPDDGFAPEWPRRPSWPATGRPVEATTIAGRKLVPSADAAAMWAASAREVMSAGPTATSSPGREAVSTPTPQPCVQCGLSLSANARFCRRCGARQG